ncbi:MAG: hypothetical protein ACLR78_00900 [Roseburia sp.]
MYATGNHEVALDAMGGDNAPGELVKGAVDAVNGRSDIKVLLVGQQDVVEKELKQYSYPKEQIEVVHAEEVIETAEPPVNAIRKKKQSSIVVGMNMVKQKEADAFVSAGSSGAILVGGQVIVGRIRGIEETAFGTIDSYGKGSLFIDRLWCERRCEGITSGSVCKDGIHLYGKCSWN